MSQGGLHSLATVMKRLEAATSRLEDLADDQARRTSSTSPTISMDRAPPTVATPAPGPPPSAPLPPPRALPAAPPSTTVEVPRSVTAYDQAVITEKFQPFLELTKGMGGPLVEQAKLLATLFADLRSFILMASACKKPDKAVMGPLIDPLVKNINAIAEMKQLGHKERIWANHLAAIADAAPTAGWITIEPTTVPFIEDIKQSVEYYGNRIIKEFKEKDPKHAPWVRGLYSVIDAMKVYVKEYHTTGLIWNPKGMATSQYNASAPAAGGPPPPPPPPPPPAGIPSSGSQAPADGAGAVFAQLNKGEAVTQGLRKVDKSEMTHKNPSLRASSVVPDRSSSPLSPSTGKKPLRPSKPQALAGKKPAKFALEGAVWAIDNQEDVQSLVVDQAQLNQSVSLFGCKNSTIIIKGKVNAVTLVNCKKTSVLVESVISQVSVTNSPSFTIQITGSAPMIQLDSTDSGQIYLSKESLHTEITTAKCSSINVSLPVVGEEDGVFEEQAVPEMLRTVIKDGKLVTVVVEHVG